MREEASTYRTDHVEFHVDSRRHVTTSNISTTTHRASMPSLPTSMMDADFSSHSETSHTSRSDNLTLMEGVSTLDKILKSNDEYSEDDYARLLKLKTSLMKGFVGSKGSLPKLPPKPKVHFGRKRGSNSLYFHPGILSYEPTSRSHTAMSVMQNFGAFQQEDSNRSISSQSHVEHSHKSRISIGRLATSERETRNSGSRRYNLKLNILKTRRASSLLSKTQSHAPDKWYTLPLEKQIKLSELLSWNSLSKWDFDVFEISKLTNNRPLLFVGWAILSSPYAQHVMEEVTLDKKENRPVPFELMDGYRFIDHFDIDQIKMINFLKEMERNYFIRNPYHNNIHAADVLQTTHSLLHGLGGIEVLKPSKLQLFAILISAVIHDLRHPGRNNLFQQNTLSKMAIRYNDQSVLENMHLAVAMEKLFGKGRIPSIDIFKNMKKSDVIKCRKLMIEAVLGTDMSKHFSNVSNAKTLIGCIDGEITSETCWGVLHFLMHMADISNTSKGKHIAIQWADRCLEEFFEQGDEEKRLNLEVSPLCSRESVSRSESQHGFIQFIVKPAFQVLEEIMPKIKTEIIPILDTNLAFWESQLEQKTIEEMDQMRASIRSSVSLELSNSSFFEDMGGIDENDDEEEITDDSSPTNSLKFVARNKETMQNGVDRTTFVSPDVPSDSESEYDC